MSGPPATGSSLALVQKLREEGRWGLQWFQLGRICHLSDEMRDATAMMMLVRLCWCAVWIGSVCLAAEAQAASFTPLGDLPGGDFDSLTTDISDDGLTVVGFSQSDLGAEAFRWTEDAGLVALSSLTGETVPTIARAVSNTGTIAGQLNYVEGEQCTPGAPMHPSAALWTEDFGFLPLGGTTLIAHDLAADGTATVGRTCDFIEDPDTGEMIPFPQPYYWNETEGLNVLDALGHSLGLSADGQSATGFVVLDHGDDTFSLQAMRWRPALGELDALGLIGPSELPAESIAKDINASGDVIIGGYRPTDEALYEGFRWTEEDGFLGLGHLAEFDSEVFDVSADGNVIVGEQFLDEEGEEVVATIWDPQGGLRNLQTLLVDEVGLGDALTGWTLERANGISADGLSIVGFGINPEGNPEGWLVRLDEIPPPALLGDYNGSGLVEQADLDLVLSHWGVDGSVPPDGWINDLPDGFIDQAELDRVLSNWGSASAALGATTAVPEPSSLLLAVGLALLAGCGIRRAR